MRKVLIYNAGGCQVLGTVPVKHAVTMVHRKVARAKDWLGGVPATSLWRVRSVELLRHVFPRWLYRPRAPRPLMVSREALLSRDHHVCAYCGVVATTIDHIVPRCQGGATTWMNCISACRSCNLAKGGRTPAQAGMVLLFEPYVPAGAHQR